MLEYVAAANAAYGIIRKAISNGRELHDCAKSIAKFTHAYDDLQKTHNTKKNSVFTKFMGKQDDDLESFMHLESLKAKQEELKQLMIYCGRPGLHADWVRYQAEARRKRIEAAKQREKELQELKENFLMVLLWLMIVSVVCAVSYFVYLAMQNRGTI